MVILPFLFLTYTKCITDSASDTPNILNVALTRAKYKFFVIGNYKLWSSKPHFQDLATVIPLTKITNEISHIAEKEEA